MPTDIQRFATFCLLQGATDSPIVQASLKSKREEVLKEWIFSGKIESPDKK
ncbi:MAG: hypothetical protein ACE5PV_09840 [Candidatus Poribacteria bacterium]